MRGRVIKIDGKDHSIYFPRIAVQEYMQRKGLKVWGEIQDNFDAFLWFWLGLKWAAVYYKQPLDFDEETSKVLFDTAETTDGDYLTVELLAEWITEDLPAPKEDKEKKTKAVRKR